MKLHVGRGTTRGALTIFPIWGGGDDRRGYSTDMSALSVGESEDGPTVPTLTAVNTGAKPLLVLEGHLFEGGWQHRMATHSVLVPPARPTAITVACVEQDRWAGAVDQSAAGRRATPFVRGGAGPGSDAQHEVWRRVATYNDRAAGVASGSLAGFLDGAQPSIARLVTGLRPLPGQTGVVIAIAGRTLMAEAFDHPRTLREQFDSIITAAGLDALGQPEVETAARSAHRLIESFEAVRLRRTDTAGLGTEARGPDGLGTAGLGTALAGRTNRADVTALTWRDRLLHTRIVNVRHPLLTGSP